MSAAAGARRARRRQAAWSVGACLAAIAATALVLAACRAEPAERLPAGTLWAGDAAQTARLLAGLERLQATPLGLAAADLRPRLQRCRRFLAFCPAGARCTLAEALRCEPQSNKKPVDLAAVAEEVRGDAGWVLVQHAPDRLLVARGTTQPNGDVVAHATLHVDAAEEPWQALLPARRAPDAAVMRDASALMHLRLRSDRGAKALGKLGEGDWSERLFGLKQKVFLAMDLEGTVELAVFDPAPGELIPPLAMALHVRRPAPATEAIESLIAAVRARWGVGRRSW
ncbi:MAG TPA: hypothetical protein VN923_00270, partial [Thermoanaerobaculia bacterium]|nr:hypothetical protein [Thermoanaerobaculia bacterium]